MTLETASWPGRIMVAIEPGGEGTGPVRLADVLAASYGSELLTLTVPDPEVGRLLRPPWSAGAPRALCRAARRADADLLVIGRGVGWADRLYLLESVAERVAAAAVLPVLVVPESEVATRVPSRPTILVAAPAGATSPACLDWGRSLAQRLSGRVEVVGIEDEGRPSALEGLRTAATRFDASLIVLSPLPGLRSRQPPGTLSRLSLVAAGLCRTAPCPVLLVPATRRIHRPLAGLALETDAAEAEVGSVGGASPTPVRWHLRTRPVQRRPTDSEAPGP